MKQIVLACALLAGGCSAEALKASPPTAGESCPTNASTAHLRVTPDVVTRGEAVTIEVSWSLYDSLYGDGAAILGLSDGAIEVEVILREELDTGSGYHDYAGQVDNPFGLGAPAGLVSVLASAEPPEGCQQTPTAATSFDLQ